MIHLDKKKDIKTRHCHYCETWVSVKNKIHTSELDRVYYGINGYVYCCNKCITKHYIGNKEIEM